jgi:hypothetical protein
MTRAQQFADEAIFILQLNTRDAVKYIQRNARCNDVEAMAAFKFAAIPIKK